MAASWCLQAAFEMRLVLLPHELILENIHLHKGMLLRAWVVNGCWYLRETKDTWECYRTRDMRDTPVTSAKKGQQHHYVFLPKHIVEDKTDIIGWARSQSAMNVDELEEELDREAIEQINRRIRKGNYDDDIPF